MHVGSARQNQIFFLCQPVTRVFITLWSDVPPILKTYCISSLEENIRGGGKTVRVVFKYRLLYKGMGNGGVTLFLLIRGNFI
jgi:hypothetical protein